MVILSRCVGSLALLGFTADGARMARKRGPLTVKPSAKYLQSSDSLSYEPHWFNITSSPLRPHTEGNMGAIGPAAAPSISPAGSPAGGPAVFGEEASQPAALAPQLAGAASSALQLASSGAGAALGDAAEVLSSLLFASSAGCFSDPATGDNRLGCAVDCKCHWYQRCYPSYIANTPSSWNPSSEADVSLASTGDQLVLQNVGRCGLGIAMMALATVSGFLGLVCCIVLFRAGTLAMEAVKEQALEGSGMHLDTLTQLRVEAARQAGAKGASLQTNDALTTPAR